MARLTQPCACADCGLVIDSAYLSAFFARPLCAICYREETNRSKRDAEIWILEQMFTRSAA
jgi:hypothetical protein